MKKILFVLLIALCGVSFSFAESKAECINKCNNSYLETQQRNECVITQCKIMQDQEKKDYN